MNIEEEKQKTIDSIHNDIIEEVIKKIPFDKIDENLFMRIVSCSQNLLDEYVNRKDIYTYRVVCDATNNTNETIRNGEVHCKIAILFTMADYIPNGWVNIDCKIEFPHLRKEDEN